MSAKTRDYYEVLGVGRDATQDEIKAAYRKRARAEHPDVNPGDKNAEERFKELQAANDVLSDPEKRAKYDRFGHDWRYATEAGADPGRPASGATSGGGFTYSDFDFGGGAGGFDFEDLFGRFRGAERARRGRDVEAEIEVTLEQAHSGARPTLELATIDVCPTCDGRGVVDDGRACPTCGGAGRVRRPKTITANIPAGMREGSTIRLAGQGGAGAAGGEPGDLYLHVRLRPHPDFRVSGDDLEVDVPIAPWEAVLGATVDVPTIGGRAQVKVPKGARTDQRLRLRGQGLSKRGGGRGDAYARLKIVVPREVSERERELYEELRKVSTDDPRGSAHGRKGAA